MFDKLIHALFYDDDTNNVEDLSEMDKNENIPSWMTLLVNEGKIEDTSEIEGNINSHSSSVFNSEKLIQTRLKLFSSGNVNSIQQICRCLLVGTKFVKTEEDLVDFTDNDVFKSLLCCTPLEWNVLMTHFTQTLCGSLLKFKLTSPEKEVIDVSCVLRGFNGLDDIMDDL